MERKRQAGGTLMLVLVAIVAIAGAGGWNYHRNVEAEAQRNAARPLSGYSTSDLEALADAYRQELSGQKGRSKGGSQTRAVAKDRAYFDEQVQEFEKVQKQAAAQRQADAAVGSVGDVDLQRVEEELRARGGAESDLDRHLRRLLTF
jgi:predicted negative regulator of RcsB-dependent stress response